MKTLSLLLVVANLFTGALNSVQSQLVSAFNIFDAGNSVEAFTHNLNILLGPVRNPAYEDIELDAKSAIIVDRDSQRTLYSKNPNERLPMASITKLMTALVVLDNYNDLSAVVSVPRAATEASGSRMYLYAGEQLTVYDLMRGMLIESANDAATALALNVSDTIDDFAKLMNAKALRLNLGNTHFVNPTGFDHEDHYSTARDIAKLAQTVMREPVLADIVGTAQVTVTDITGKFTHTLTSTNKLVGQYGNVVGIKTGTTDEAGESLVVAANGGSRQQVIAVILNSPDRFAEGKEALDWALKAYSWVEPA